MFERTIRLKRARKALREGRLEDVLRLLDDPRVRDSRSARELRQLAQDALAARLQARDVLARTLPAGASAPDPLRLVDRARGLAAAGDVAGAALQFDRLRREAPMLRTVLHDMNRELARAQGLEGGFLLRVDEGGEHLVLRTESFSIGNLREGRADLPLLANLATRHARIERCMSFHGGMEDRIHAEDGELRVAGAPCASHRLAHGDVVTLGGLRIRYELPSRRSLTARLRLLGASRSRAPTACCCSRTAAATAGSSSAARGMPTSSSRGRVPRWKCTVAGTGNSSCGARPVAPSTAARSRSNTRWSPVPWSRPVASPSCSRPGAGPDRHGGKSAAL